MTFNKITELKACKIFGPEMFQMLQLAFKTWKNWRKWKFYEKRSLLKKNIKSINTVTITSLTSVKFYNICLSQTWNLWRAFRLSIWKVLLLCMGRYYKCCNNDIWEGHFKIIFFLQSHLPHWYLNCHYQFVCNEKIRPPCNDIRLGEKFLINIVIKCILLVKEI